MIHRNKIFTNFATSNKDYPVHSSSGLGRRPLTAETRSLLAGFFCLAPIQVDHATTLYIHQLYI